MPNSPKKSEEKIERMITAWRTLAPDKSFGGMTLGEFEAFAETSRAPRRRLEELRDEIKQEEAARDRADVNFLAKAELVVAGVVADPTEGNNSALYEAMGYVRKSERQSGLTRKKKNVEDT